MRTLIATDGQENGPFRAQTRRDGWSSHRQSRREHLFLEFASPVRLKRLAEHSPDLGLLRTERFGEDLRRIAVPRQGRLQVVNLLRQDELDKASLTGFSLA